MGLGIPIVWCVHEEDAKGMQFDTRQYPHILWEEPSDLRTKLEDRVLALYPQ